MRSGTVGALAFIAFSAACTGGTEPATRLEASASSGPVVEAVTGAGHIFQPSVGGGFVRRRLTFTAHRNADGSVEGSWQLVAGAAIIRGSIICFEIEGATARVGGIVEQAKFTTFIEGTDTGWYLEDNGEGPAAPEDRSGRLMFNGAPGTAAAYCAGDYTDPRVETVLEIYGGNVQLSE